MQTKLHTLIESLLGTAIGFIISLAVWEYVVKPIWGIQTSFAENFQITLLFTVVSIIRSYLVRRYFNRLTIKIIRGRNDSIDRNLGARPRR